MKEVQSHIKTQTDAIAALDPPATTHAVLAEYHQKLYRYHCLGQEIARRESSKELGLSVEASLKATELGIKKEALAGTGMATASQILASEKLSPAEIAHIIHNGLVGSVAVNEV